MFKKEIYNYLVTILGSKVNLWKLSVYKLMNNFY